MNDFPFYIVSEGFKVEIQNFPRSEISKIRLLALFLKIVDDHRLVQFPETANRSASFPVIRVHRQSALQFWIQFPITVNIILKIL